MDKKTFKRKVAAMVKRDIRFDKTMDGFYEEVEAVSKGDKKAFLEVAVKKGYTKLKGRRLDKAFDLFKQLCLSCVAKQIIMRRAMKVAGL